MRIYLLIALLSTRLLVAQTLSGTVFGTDASEKQSPVVGATVFWQETSTGALTDSLGRFSLPVVAGKKLVVRAAGFHPDTVAIADPAQPLNLSLKAVQIAALQIDARQSATTVSALTPMKTETLGARELQKAACCNLSESFETTPSVDVAFNDAITGTKQIQMLGLSGTYVQTTIEAIPAIRGLAASIGLDYVPGPWVHGIQVSKGVGSVANGYESMTGQINVELLRPEEATPLALNAYADGGGRYELNGMWARRLSRRWYTGVLAHGSVRTQRNDMNGDGFLDFPLTQQANVVSRWKFVGDNGWESEFGVRMVADARNGGQLPRPEGVQRYAVDMNTRRIEGFAKLGKVMEKPATSTGLQLAYTRHDQTATYGLRNYTGASNTLYANWIWQSILGTTTHSYRAGLSFLADDYNETFTGLKEPMLRIEVVPGMFAEYTYSHPTGRFTAVAGLRADAHNLYGVFVTPRLHLRWQAREHLTLRLSAGRGQRTANPFTDQTSVFASSRQLVRLPSLQERREISWNTGINATQIVKLGDKAARIGVEIYRTWFDNQLITDLETPGEVAFYGLAGKSYSNSLQADGEMEIFEGFTAKAAYKWLDVQTTYGQNTETRLLEKPFVARQRAFLNIGYDSPESEDGNRWHLDATAQWYGTKRIPNTSQNPALYQLEANSPAFFLFNALVSYRIHRKWDVYVGGENLGNFMQMNPMVAARDPFGPYFDGSLVWGPIFGRMFYGGIRWDLEKLP